MLQPEASESPDSVQAQHKSPAAELKGSVFTLTVLKIYHDSSVAIEQEIHQRIAKMPRFFENAPVVIDLGAIRDRADEINFQDIESMLRKLHLIPIGVCNGRLEQNTAAIKAGLAVLRGRSNQDIAATREKLATQPQCKPPTQEKHELAASPVNKTNQIDNQTIHDNPTRVIKQPIRSGQQVYAKGGDLVLLCAVNAGAEVLADGNIHAYAPLRGRALAGVSGNQEARIFCQAVEAELIAIAGNYRVFDNSNRTRELKQPSQIYLEDEQLKIKPLIDN